MSNAHLRFWQSEKSRVILGRLRYRSGGKRVVDISLIVLGSVILLPLVAIITLLVPLESRGPILFVQKRVGRQGHLFHIYKFRTMIHSARNVKEQVFGLDEAVTRIGYWLRRYKLDELPQVLNILKGEMSIVGPRPALPDHVVSLHRVGRKRLEVRPGLTGLAQVNGNIYLDWQRRWEYDARYIENISFRLDCWIMIRTLVVILAGEDRYAPSE